MPSGPKKRKAAKKKKENQLNNHLGDDDVNQQIDENINDAGVMDSFAGQGAIGHQSCSAEREKEEIEKGNDSSNPEVSEHSVIKIEREFEIGDKPEEKYGWFEDEESVSKSSSEGSSETSGGSDSNSDDESHDNGISRVTVDIPPDVESWKAADYLYGRSEENEFCALNEETGNAVEEISHWCEDGAEKHVNSRPNNSLPSSAAESVFKENEEIKPRSVDDKVDALMDSTISPSEATSQSIENMVTISDPTTEENDDSLGLSHDEPVIEENGIEHQRKSEITEAPACFIHVLVKTYMHVYPFSVLSSNKQTKISCSFFRFQLQCRHHGRVVVDCLNCLRGLLDDSSQGSSEDFSKTG